jgi:hypothetical protein
MIDRLERVGRNPQSHRTPERVGNQRHVEQIGQKSPFGLSIGMADLVPNLAGFPGQLASPCHGRNP